MALRVFTSSAAVLASEWGTYSPSPVSPKSGGMSLKGLPRNDLAVAKPVGPRVLALVSDFTRFDPPEFGSPQPNHGVASRYEALREDAWPHVLISRLKPIAHLVVPAQPRPAGNLEHNLGIGATRETRQRRPAD